MSTTPTPTPTLVTVRGIPVDPGCWVDGHWGQYGASRVLRICDELTGSHLFEECERDVRADMLANPDDYYGVTDPMGSHVDELASCEIVSWAHEQAEQDLNDATDGGYWEWNDGEFFLVSDGAEDDEDA